SGTRRGLFPDRARSQTSLRGDGGRSSRHRPRHQIPGAPRQQESRSRRHRRPRATRYARWPPAIARAADAPRSGGSEGQQGVRHAQDRAIADQRTRLASRLPGVRSHHAGRRGGAIQSLQPGQARDRRSGDGAAHDGRHISDRRHQRLHRSRAGGFQAAHRTAGRQHGDFSLRHRSISYLRLCGRLEGEDMTRSKLMKSLFLGSAAVLATASAQASDFNVPGGDLKTALHAYIKQAGVPLIVSDDAVKGVRTAGAKGDLSADEALSRILADTGFTMHRHASGAIAVVQDEPPPTAIVTQEIQLAQLAPRGASVETVTVTSSKLGGADVQSVPIAITAMSQEQLTATQTAGGPDLVKNVPNLTFTKTNFTGYNIQIRGIGTQAISVTTDPAVAVAFNDTPFLRNHFFEQEFFDVSQVE